jgi:hypothetical protein
VVVLQGVGYTYCRYNAVKFCLIICCLLFVSCQRDSTIDLDKAKKQRFGFAELPTPVKEEIEQNIAEIANSEFDYNVSLNDEFALSYIRIGGGETWLDDIQRNYHILLINEKVMKLRGNQGDPFIIYDSVLYYTEELNFMDERYKTAAYIGVDLTPFLR